MRRLIASLATAAALVGGSAATATVAAPVASASYSVDMNVACQVNYGAVGWRGTLSPTRTRAATDGAATSSVAAVRSTASTSSSTARSSTVCTPAVVRPPTTGVATTSRLRQYQEDAALRRFPAQGLLNLCYS